MLPGSPWGLIVDNLVCGFVKIIGVVAVFHHQIIFHLVKLKIPVHTLPVEAFFCLSPQICQTSTLGIFVYRFVIKLSVWSKTTSVKKVFCTIS
jgi:hypothetical protein